MLNRLYSFCVGIVLVVGCHLDSSQSFKISGMTLKDYSEWSQWQERAEMRQGDYGTYGDNGTDYCDNGKDYGTYNGTDYGTDYGDNGTGKFACYLNALKK